MVFSFSVKETRFKAIASLTNEGYGEWDW